MDFLKILKNKFGNNILNVKMQNDILTIEVDTCDLEQTIKFTKEIQQEFKEKNINYDDINLEVLSRGKKLEVEISELNQHFSNMLKFEFKKPIEEHKVIIAKLKEINDDSVLVIWNQKGRIRKISIDKNNIKKIEIYIKF
ncbi:ribosome assembly cofactor RimP [Mycoplasmopsis cricetuli]|uniref:ribosome assembly cofactor RimP n=1 Tax=Mycoplasmopsis cricetuli TaxID=171283 RepID=UPI00047237BF|nr:ribosome assembly cofactor RimP [Mycoplasmopsis cricetuli]